MSSSPNSTLRAGRWLLELTWQTDRYRQRLWRLPPGAQQIAPHPSSPLGQVLVNSVEGSAEQPWPPSPPLQQAHCESRPGGQQVALLVGLAGRSHWSLAITLDPQSDCVTWEAACRLQEEPEWLGSTYQIAPEAELVVGGAEGTPSCPGSPSPRLSVQGFPSPARVVTPEATDRRLQLAPAGTAGPLPRTVCWSYRIVAG